MNNKILQHKTSMLSPIRQKTFTPNIILPTQNFPSQPISCDLIEPTSPKLSTPYSEAPTMESYPIQENNSPMECSILPFEPSTSPTTSNTINYGLIEPTNPMSSTPYSIALALESCPIQVNYSTIQSSMPPLEPSTSPSTSNTFNYDLLEATSSKHSTPNTIASTFESFPIRLNFPPIKSSIPHFEPTTLQPIPNTLK